LGGSQTVKLLNPSDPPGASFGNPHPQAIVYPPDRRLARMRFLSKLLDNSILLPGGYRIGIDPLLGLLPGVGDAVSSILSLWIIWEGALLGLPLTVLIRMLINLGVDTLGGSIPVLGDLFDAVWKANAMNMILAEKHYSPTAKRRNPLLIVLIFGLVSLLFVGTALLAAWWLLRSILLLLKG
jgi:hypothetical protein